MLRFWRDPDKRRAFLLTVVVHTGALLGVAWLAARPQLEREPDYIIIDLGPPIESQELTDAATADEDAPQAQAPEVAADQTGTPQEAQVEVPGDDSQPSPDPAPEQAADTPSETDAPELEQADTEPDPVVEQAEAEPEPEAESVVESEAEPEQVAEAEPEPVVEPEPVAEAEPEPVAETESEQAEVEQVEPEQAEVEQAEAPEPEQTDTAEPAPAEASAPPPPPSEVALEDDADPEAAQATLPEIDAVAPLRPPEVAIPIPTPEVSAQLPTERPITATPSVEVAAERPLPRPQVEVTVTESRALEATPQVSVATARAITPTPQVQVITPRELAALPQVTVTESRAITPTPEVSVAAPRSLETTPQVAVSAARPVETTPQVSVSAPRSVDATPQVSVAAPRALEATPQVAVAASRPVTPIPQVSVALPRELLRPQVGVTVTRPEPGVSDAAEADGETVAEAEPDEVTAAGQEGGSRQDELLRVLSERRDNRASGGNSDQAGQTSAEDAAELNALGVATSPDGVTEPEGAPAGREPYQETRTRPLTVILDNANGYPQAGLRQASTIFELPVEGGLTRLMTVYDDIDPGEVGPIRSARDYFYRLSESMDGILVHIGGAPSAMVAIQSGRTPTFDALTRNELFAREGGRSAPYNLYSAGSALRQAVNRLELGRSFTVSGEVYTPAEDTPAADTLSVSYPGGYSSGFRYTPNTNLYHWQRGGEGAVDASGENVLVRAVVIARVAAQPIPGDLEGRLYMPLAGGEATLYLSGRAVTGTWSLAQGGFRFISADGEDVDLAPFKTWVQFVPQNATVQE